MSELSELMDMIRDDRAESDRKLAKMFDTFRHELNTDMALAHAVIREETRELVRDMLPHEHRTDHDTVKMLRRWGTAFLGGLFGNMGRTIFFIILLGIGIQVLNPKAALPVTEILTGVLTK